MLYSPQSQMKYMVTHVRGLRSRHKARPPRRHESAGGGGLVGRAAAYVGSPTQLSNYLTLKGSFSAVSKQNFASKYGLESSRRDLRNALLCTFLESFAPFSKLNFLLFENP